MTKRRISIITSIMFIFTFIVGIIPVRFSATAEIIVPTIVKTEEWTTSYYIDGNKDILYPYVKCIADIYSDGSIDLRLYNTHEWTGFSYVKHEIALFYMQPVHSGDIIYELYINGCYDRPDQYPIYTMSETFENVGFSCYPSCYGKIDKYYNGCTITHAYSSENGGEYSLRIKGTYKKYILAPVLSVYTDLPSLYVRNEEDNECGLMYHCKFKPGIHTDYNETNYTEFFKQSYNFSLFGHDITITPDMIDLESYGCGLNINKATVTGNTLGDVNGDNIITAVDASKILTLYATINEGNIDITDKELDICDINKDGLINAIDASFILRYYAYLNDGGGESLNSFTNYSII